MAAVADTGHGDGSARGEMSPVGWHEIAGLAPLMALIVLIGIYPKPFLDRIQPPLKRDRGASSRRKPKAVAVRDRPPETNHGRPGREVSPSSSTVVPKKIGD